MKSSTYREALKPGPNPVQYRNRRALLAALALVAVAVWWLWPRASDDVRAIYYPDRDNLLVAIQSDPLRSVTECRKWVAMQAKARGDFAGPPDDVFGWPRDAAGGVRLMRGDYECGISPTDQSELGVAISRETVR